MGKGSKRRPGKGYEDNYEKIFGNKKAQSTRVVVRGGKLVEAGETVPGAQIHVIQDIEPFQSPITKEVITSRSQLRQHHKEHGTTDSRDYSSEFMEKKWKERSESMCGMTKQDRRDRIEALRDAFQRR